MKIIAALDLGTTKFSAVIAEQLAEYRYRILGMANVKAQGVESGIVLNVHTASTAINEVMSAAVSQAGIEVKEVNVGVSGEHIRMIRHRNFVTVTNVDHEIHEADIERLEDDAKRVRIAEDGIILHVIPEEYCVEGVPGRDTPIIFRGATKRQELIGMMADRIEAVNQIVYASKRAVQNIRNAVGQAGFQVREFVLQPIASASAILQENEKDIGVMIMDIGAGTTDITIVNRGSIIYSRLIGVAGQQLTEDIRTALRVVDSDAESIKKSYGFASPKSVIQDDDIRVEGIGAWGSELMPTSALAQIINARLTRLFEQIDHEIKTLRLHDKFSAGIILTGGAALLRGLPELAKDIFGVPARVGFPIRSLVSGFTPLEKPEYSAVVGLLLGGPGKRELTEMVNTEVETNVEENRIEEPKAKKGFFNGIFNFIKSLYDEIKGLF